MSFLKNNGCNISRSIKVNPRILKHDDTYVLIYMGSTHPYAGVTNPDTLTMSSPYTTLARSNKRIGIATSRSPYGPWERRDKPILDTKPGTFYSFLTSNPSPWINEDGSVIMLFKSRKYQENFPFQSSMMIGVATAPSIDGPFEVVGDEPIFGVDKMGEIEDPFLWKDETGYHMLAKDQRGSLTGNRHDGIRKILRFQNRPGQDFIKFRIISLLFPMFGLAGIKQYGAGSG